MKRLLPIAVLFVVLLTGGISHANIYGYQDKNGVYHFTNVAPVNKKYRTVIHTATQHGSSRLMTSRSGQALTGDRKELIDVARTYLGTPYKLGGNLFTGIDCSGFVKKVFSTFSVSLPRTAREQYREGRPVDKDDLLAGDLVFFRSEKSSDPAHVGIFIDNDKFIHASTRNGGGVRIDSLDDTYYRRTFMGASRLLQ